MKFQQLYLESNVTDKFEFEHSYVTKDAKLSQCIVCTSFTRWIDGLSQKHVCSEECCSEFWKSSKFKTQLRHNQFDVVSKSAKIELAFANNVQESWKDIVIVVKDQLPYFQICIESVMKHTKNYTLYIWDNGSGEDTKKYIEELQKQKFNSDDDSWDIEVWTSEDNIGFIEPNNKMAALGNGDYIILLNSDTKVFENWDSAMVGWLQNNEGVLQVGYWGGHLGGDGKGFGGDYGYDVDYIPGWCFCISRDTYNKFGLFDDKNLKFAYCEDSDFSLRLKESGAHIYALHLPLVYHFQNKTIQAVNQESNIDVKSTFDHNHEYIKTRWKDYLLSNRVYSKKEQ